MNLIVVVAVGMDALRLYFQWKIFLALLMMATAERSLAAAMVSSLLVLLDFFQPIDDWKYPFFFVNARALERITLKEICKRKTHTYIL